MSTFLNCHGSSKSSSSSFVSGDFDFRGVQSVYTPIRGSMYGRWIYRQRLQSISLAYTTPACGFSRIHTIPAKTADDTWSPVALWFGANFRVSWILSLEPYQQAFFSCPQSNTPSSSMPSEMMSSVMIFHFSSGGGVPLLKRSLHELTASSQGWQAQWTVGL